MMVLLMLLTILSGCTPTSNTVQKATAQKWYGGVAGSGGGRIYRVFIKKSPKSNLQITQVFIGNNSEGIQIPFRIFQDSSRTELKEGEIAAGLNLFRIEFSETFPGRAAPGFENDNPPPNQGLIKVKAPTPLPESFDKGVVISYLNKGKKEFWVITNFENLPPLAYP